MLQNPKEIMRKYDLKVYLKLTRFGTNQKGIIINHSVKTNICAYNRILKPTLGFFICYAPFSGEVCPIHPWRALSHPFPDLRYLPNL